MKRISIVILTDHTNHSQFNSFYGIATELFLQFGVREVIIVSRKDKRNKGFFTDGNSDHLYGVKLTEPIYFENREILDFSDLIILRRDVYFLLRLPHPVSPTFLLNLEKEHGADRIINRPSGILKTGSKAFLPSLNREFIPSMNLCETAEGILAFLEEHPKSVLKPIMNYGGKGIVKIEEDKVYTEQETISLSEFISNYRIRSQTYLAVEYLENVKNGDKRIVVADGQILSATLRFPAEGGWLCNIAQGGRDKVSEPTLREKEIVEYLSPILLNEGILIYGLDTLENNRGERVISEINTLSPGGITPYEMHTGDKVTQTLAKLIIDYCYQKT